MSSSHSPKSGNQISLSGVSDKQGFYRIEQLTLGTYNVVVKAPGFKVAENTGFRVSSGQDLCFDFSLEIGSTAQTVTVAAAPLLNLENPEITNTFDWNARTCRSAGRGADVDVVDSVHRRKLLLLLTKQP